MSLDEQTQTLRSSRRYLFFPWIASLLVALAIGTGIADWIWTLLPFNLGRIAIRNLWPGMLLLLIGCSALWSSKALRSSGYRGAGLIAGTTSLTLFVILIQLCVVVLILSIGEVLLGPFVRYC